jgi:uncharacterized protein YecT (DUF1311 family)
MIRNSENPLFLKKINLMKYLALIAVLFFVLSKGHAQLGETELDSLKKSWTNTLLAEMAEQGIGTSNESGWSEFADSIMNAYEKDTFLLNGLLTYRLEADQTTQGMVDALMDYENGYDALLNKYYKLLLKKLSGNDKEVLRKSQRNWIALRDSERELSAVLTEENYSGGGTIQRLFYADWYADFTKHRTEELIDYLTRLIE